MQANPADATPMMRQFLHVKAQHPDVLLLYRMGDFYETFFEDALQTAKLLELTLTGRESGALGRVPMAGVPVRAVDTYIQRLLGMGYRVAIGEQLPEAPPENETTTAKGLMDRKIVRVLTPGTVTEANHLPTDAPNYLAVLHWPAQPDALGCLAWCDVAQGEFALTCQNQQGLLSELARLQPAEVVVKAKRRKGLGGEGVAEWVADVSPVVSQVVKQVVPLPPHVWEASSCQRRLLNWANVPFVEGLGFGAPTDETTQLAVVACGVLLSYLQTSFPEGLPLLAHPTLVRGDTTVYLPAVTRQHLELTHTARDQQSQGSLLHAINRTTTAMGARLLRQWLGSPLKHLPTLLQRQLAVEQLLQHEATRLEVRRLLAPLNDVERLACRAASGNLSPREMQALGQSLARLPAVADVLTGFEGDYLRSLQHLPEAVEAWAETLQSTLADELPLTLTEGGLLAQGVDARVDELRQALATAHQWLAQYEATQRQQTGLKTLKLVHSSAFGYALEVSKGAVQGATLPTEYRRKQTLTNAERYTTDELAHFEQRLSDTQQQLVERELAMFVELRTRLKGDATLLLEAARRVATLDVLQSLATLAHEQHYCKPTLLEHSLELTLIDARHPVLEQYLPAGKFVANTCQLQGHHPSHPAPTAQEAAQVAIITGPNMAGKSTYMRQVALCVLLAQIGSYVPARAATVGLVDALFTRIGAVDDLSQGQSTFMVEMHELAHMLHNATPRSLLILDEVGRGTSTYDGVAIAYSVVEHLVQTLGCRTLFATHYHELNVLEASLSPYVGNYRVAVAVLPQGSDGDDGEQLVFLHRVEAGAAQRSYGVQVARMAGLPPSLVQRADAKLAALQRDAEAGLRQRRQRLVADTAVSADQLALFDAVPSV